MEDEDGCLINIENCDSIGGALKGVSWTMKAREAWLVTGGNGGGADEFLLSLSRGAFKPASQGGNFFSAFGDSVEIVSLERAARLIQEERENDDSEYIEGGVDIGRTGRAFIAEALGFKTKKGAPLPPEAARIETYPAVKLCGIEGILDRGLKYMSTGEIRRTLLARALLSGKKLLLLSDPFDGLDAQSRGILREFFETVARKQLSQAAESSSFPRMILGMERGAEIPEPITHVLEFRAGKISFRGKIFDYKKILEERNASAQTTRERDKALFKKSAQETSERSALAANSEKNQSGGNLVEFHHVNVGWGGHEVLVDLSWTLREGEHWLIRGPNGSGKTTFLELITGDNTQVYCNDVSLFGKRRGTGETMWDIKAKLGIVSYRVHVEYRMTGGTTLRDVIISGFKDSIGLYEAPTGMEAKAAIEWLALGGFAGREDTSFGALSYGEQRAALILRAAVKCPPILILDEPCHALDDSYRQKILDLLETIAESGTTTLLHVTHDESEALPCEKRVLELRPGEKPMYKILRKH